MVELVVPQGLDEQDLKSPKVQEGYPYGKPTRLQGS